MNTQMPAVRRFLLAALAATAAAGLAILAGSHESQAAGAKPTATQHQSSVFFEGTDTESIPGTVIVYGNVTSSTRHCLKNRKIEIYPVRFKRTAKPEDVAVSGKNGYFAAGVDAAGYEASKFKMKAMKYGTRKHPQVCSADTLQPLNAG